MKKYAKVTLMVEYDPEFEVSPERWLWTYLVDSPCRVSSVQYVRPTGTYYIAPAGQPNDEWAVGYDANVFDTADEAEAEIHKLAQALRTDPTDWIVCRRGGAD